MAKFKRIQKENIVDAYKFEADKPDTWPEGIIENDKSITGYSYGTLEITVTSEKFKFINPKTGNLNTKTVSSPNKDGFEISDGDYLLIDSNGKARKYKGDNFLNDFEPAN